MNVLSLFDGMSCGQIALNQLGFKVDNYFASEIDEYAIKIAKKNFPNIIHIGDVLKVKGSELPKIDLLIGGSPCQGFSFAGKQLNFNDPRSALFFEFVRLLKETNPKYFLLENVRMKTEYQDVITEHLNWIEPIAINSSLVSAQNRNRLYWTNIPNVDQPEDKKIVLKEIMQDLPFKDGLLKYTYNKKDFKLGSLCHHIGTANLKGGQQLKRVYAETGKSPTLTTISGGCQEKKVSNNKGLWRELSPIEYERLQTVPDNYTEGVKKSARYTMLGNGWTVDVIKHIFRNMNEL
jgi:DNA (cytosine-5)-methyltransferase 3A